MRGDRKSAATRDLAAIMPSDPRGGREGLWNTNVAAGKNEGTSLRVASPSVAIMTRGHRERQCRGMGGWASRAGSHGSVSTLSQSAPLCCSGRPAPPHTSLALISPHLRLLDHANRSAISNGQLSGPGDHPAPSTRDKRSEHVTYIPRPRLWIGICFHEV